MTPTVEQVIKDPAWEFGDIGTKVFRKRRKCGHYELLFLNGTYNAHSGIFSLINRKQFKPLNKQTYFMIITIENALKAYKNNPNQRKLLEDLFGDFISSETKLEIAKDEKIKELEEKLAKCESNGN